MASKAEWDAWIEKGAVLWHWSVQRDWAREPHVVSRGDFLHGFAFTEQGARKKAREWLANRIEWAAPKPDRRIFIGDEVRTGRDG